MTQNLNNFCYAHEIFEKLVDGTQLKNGKKSFSEAFCSWFFKETQQQVRKKKCEGLYNENTEKEKVRHSQAIGQKSNQWKTSKWCENLRQ